MESPQRRLHALRVTMKPHDWTREAIRHRLDVDSREGAEQTWQPEWVEPVNLLARQVADRLGLVLASPPAAAEERVDPAAGAVHLRIGFADGTPLALARAVAVACSSRFPETWFRLEPLALIGGRFYRRERGYKLHLRPATDVHLPREVRGAIADLLPSRRQRKPHNLLP